MGKGMEGVESGRNVTGMPTDVFLPPFFCRENIDFGVWGR